MGGHILYAPDLHRFSPSPAIFPILNWHWWERGAIETRAGEDAFPGVLKNSDLVWASGHVDCPGQKPFASFLPLLGLRAPIDLCL